MPDAKTQPTNRQTHLSHLVQIGLLKRFKSEGTRVCVHLLNGEKWFGKITAYDQYVIEFTEDSGAIIFLYKHGVSAFSTAIPA